MQNQRDCINSAVLDKQANCRHESNIESTSETNNPFCFMCFPIGHVVMNSMRIQYRDLISLHSTFIDKKWKGKRQSQEKEKYHVL